MAGHGEGDEPADEETPEWCCFCGSAENVRRCGQCKAVSYCSKTCQKSHRLHHTVYCSAIKSLEELEKEKLYQGFTVRQYQVDFRTKKKLLRLVGRKPLLSCVLDGKKAEVLWDTGSMISMVDRVWLDKNFPNTEIKPITDFMEEELEVRAANSTTIQLDGVVVLDFSLADEGETVSVPFVVSSRKLVEPILGYNVIEDLVLHGTPEHS